jgi:phage terminase small subunit
MAGRPPKTADIIRLEKKSHRTKKELNHREKTEKSLLTGMSFREKSYVKNNPTAHNEFLRIKKLLAKIGKNDGLQENIINRYCMIYAEYFETEMQRKNMCDMLDELSERKDEIEFNEYVKNTIAIQNHINTLDRQLNTKQEMLLKIEKESLMTTASALRAVTKQPPKEEDTTVRMFG